MTSAQDFVNWFYEANRERIEQQVIDAVLYGRAWVRMFGQPPDEDDEPMVYGFGEEKVMVKGESPWDRLPVPQTAEQFKEKVADTVACDMFFATRGLPRAFMEIPSQHDDSPERVVYVVLGYIANGLDMTQAEPLLVGQLWRDMVHIRKQFATIFGTDMTPILFWRRELEFSQSDPPHPMEHCFEHSTQDVPLRARECGCANRPVRSKITIRIGVPGLDLTRMFSRDGVDIPELPRHNGACSNQNPINPVGKYIGATECGCIQYAADRAAALKANQAAVDERMRVLMRPMEMQRGDAAADVPFAVGQAGLMSEDQAKKTSALRALLDSQAIASRPATVSITATEAEKLERDDLVRQRDMINKLEGK